MDCTKYYNQQTQQLCVVVVDVIMKYLVPWILTQRKSMGNDKIQWKREWKQCSWALKNLGVTWKSKLKYFPKKVKKPVDVEVTSKHCKFIKDDIYEKEKEFKILFMIIKEVLDHSSDSHQSLQQEIRQRTQHQTQPQTTMLVPSSRLNKRSKNKTNTTQPQCTNHRSNLKYIGNDNCEFMADGSYTTDVDLNESALKSAESPHNSSSNLNNINYVANQQNLNQSQHHTQHNNTKKRMKRKRQKKDTDNGLYENKLKKRKLNLKKDNKRMSSISSTLNVNNIDYVDENEENDHIHNDTMNHHTIILTLTSDSNAVISAANHSSINTNNASDITNKRFEGNTNTIIKNDDDPKMMHQKHVDNGDNGVLGVTTCGFGGYDDDAAKYHDYDGYNTLCDVVMKSRKSSSTLPANNILCDDDHKMDQSSDPQHKFQQQTQQQIQQQTQPQTLMLVPPFRLNKRSNGKINTTQPQCVNHRSNTKYTGNNDWESVADGSHTTNIGLGKSTLKSAESPHDSLSNLNNVNNVDNQQNRNQSYHQNQHNNIEKRIKRKIEKRDVDNGLYKNKIKKRKLNLQKDNKRLSSITSTLKVNNIDYVDETGENNDIHIDTMNDNAIIPSSTSDPNAPINTSNYSSINANNANASNITNKRFEGNPDIFINIKNHDDPKMMHQEHVDNGDNGDNGGTMHGFDGYDDDATEFYHYDGYNTLDDITINSGKSSSTLLANNILCDNNHTMDQSLDRQHKVQQQIQQQIQQQMQQQTQPHTLMLVHPSRSNNSSNSKTNTTQSQHTNRTFNSKCTENNHCGSMTDGSYTNNIGLKECVLNSAESPRDSSSNLNNINYVEMQQKLIQSHHHNEHNNTKKRIKRKREKRDKDNDLYENKMKKRKLNLKKDNKEMSSISSTLNVNNIDSVDENGEDDDIHNDTMNHNTIKPTSASNSNVSIATSNHSIINTTHKTFEGNTDIMIKNDVDPKMMHQDHVDITDNGGTRHGRGVCDDAVIFDHHAGNETLGGMVNDSGCCICCDAIQRSPTISNKKRREIDNDGYDDLYDAGEKRKLDLKNDTISTIPSLSNDNNNMVNDKSLSVASSISSVQFMQQYIASQAQLTAIVAKCLGRDPVHPELEIDYNTGKKRRLKQSIRDHLEDIHINGGSNTLYNLVKIGKAHKWKGVDKDGYIKILCIKNGESAYCDLVLGSHKTYDVRGKSAGDMVGKTVAIAPKGGLIYGQVYIASETIISGKDLLKDEWTKRHYIQTPGDRKRWLKDRKQSRVWKLWNAHRYSDCIYFPVHKPHSGRNGWFKCKPSELSLKPILRARPYIPFSPCTRTIHKKPPLEDKRYGHSNTIITSTTSIIQTTNGVTFNAIAPQKQCRINSKLKPYNENCFKDLEYRVQHFWPLITQCLITRIINELQRNQDLKLIKLCVEGWWLFPVDDSEELKLVLFENLKKQPYLLNVLKKKVNLIKSTHYGSEELYSSRTKQSDKIQHCRHCLDDFRKKAQKVANRCDYGAKQVNDFHIEEAVVVGKYRNLGICPKCAVKKDVFYMDVNVNNIKHWKYLKVFGRTEDATKIFFVGIPNTWNNQIFIQEQFIPQRTFSMHKDDAKKIIPDLQEKINHWIYKIPRNTRYIKAKKMVYLQQAEKYYIKMWGSKSQYALNRPFVFPKKGVEVWYSNYGEIEFNTFAGFQKNVFERIKHAPELFRELKDLLASKVFPTGLQPQQMELIQKYCSSTFYKKIEHVLRFIGFSMTKAYKGRDTCFKGLFKEGKDVQTIVLDNEETNTLGNFWPDADIVALKEKKLVHLLLKNKELTELTQEQKEDREHSLKEAKKAVRKAEKKMRKSMTTKKINTIDSPIVDWFRNKAPRVLEIIEHIRYLVCIMHFGLALEFSQMAPTLLKN